MKKNILIIILLLSIFTFNINVFADADSAQEGDANYNSLKSSYEKGITSVNVGKDSTWVTIYGLSNCEGSKCTYNYANNTSLTNFEDVLKKTVKCTNGEKYITYNTNIASGGLNYKGENKDNVTGKVYWSEDIFVSCTSTSTGNNVIQLENTANGSGTSNSGTSNSGTSNSGTSNSGTSNSGTSNLTNSTGGSYNSSSTTNNPNQGVETYYIIIGIIGLLTYAFMIFVKKHNVFKKI